MLTNHRLELTIKLLIFIWKIVFMGEGSPKRRNHQVGYIRGATRPNYSPG